MGCQETHLTYEEQLDRFISRGMLVKDRAKAIDRLKHISYYKIKEFSMFFMDTNGKYKKNTYFEAVVQNFYYDKNLRMEFLKCSEKIELSIKNKIAYILGAKYGAFGYLTFGNWCNRKIDKKKIDIEQEKFRKKLLKKMKLFSNNPIIYEFTKQNPTEEFPSIWRVSEILTFGEILHIFEIMSQKNKISVVRQYGLTIDEFTSYANNIKLIRNLCAHNMGIINIHLKSIPKINQDISNIISRPDRILTSIFIMVHLVKIINPKYRFKDLYHILNQLIQRDTVGIKYGVKKKKYIKKFLGIKLMSNKK